MSRIRTTRQAADIRQGLFLGYCWGIMGASDWSRLPYARNVLRRRLVAAAFLRSTR
jgi:hypothetical protein